MNATFSFEEEPFEFEPEYETQFNPKNFESELADQKRVRSGQSPAAAKSSSNTARRCPPNFECLPDLFKPDLRQRHEKELCDAILGAINLAKKAAAELEAKPLRPGTVNKFLQFFCERPSDLWPLPWDPRRKMRAGDIVASRFRTVAKELQTRNTLYRCICSGSVGVSGSGPQRDEYHPTETIVRDPPDPKIPAVAWAVLCKNEVRLCPPFWTSTPEGQAGTILHEMFHLCFGLTCAWFQHDRKERNMNNAYCYEAFATSPHIDAITISMCKCPK